MEYFSGKKFLSHAADISSEFQNAMLVLCVSHNAEHTLSSYTPVYCNKTFETLTGLSWKRFLDITAEDSFCGVYPADRTNAAEALERCETAGSSKQSLRLTTADGSGLWVLAHCILKTIDETDFIFISYVDIHELIGSHNALQESNSKWIDIVNSVPVGLAIFYIEDEKVTTIAVNDTFVSFANEMGRAVDGNARGWSRTQLMLLFNQDIFAFCKSQDTDSLKKMLRDSRESVHTDCTFRLRGSDDNDPIWIHTICSSKQVNETGRNYYITFQNVTSEVKGRRALHASHELLYKLSYYDSLTGVKNRNSYNQFITDCRSRPLKCAGIAFADINGLKNANDTMGHISGDNIIYDFAAIMKHICGSENIFRISGDEFLIIIQDIERHVFTEYMSRAADAVHEAGDIASIGYTWDENISDIKKRVNQAEQLMYIEKQRYYETQRSIVSRHTAEHLYELLNDIEQGRFVVYLQPKSDIDNARIIGAEALVRKLDSDGGIIPPYEFIPQLEYEKLIPQLDFYMLGQVCGLLEKYCRAGISDFRISVNMSRITIAENDYIRNIDRICSRYAFNRDQLEFEITESNRTMDHSRLEDTLSGIKALGFRISLDDVGTEYSSLPVLILDGLDTVKLDRSFVIQMDKINAAMLIKHLIRMCHDMGLDVIAEGVEDDETRLRLKHMDCDMYQGYLISRPVPADEFSKKYLGLDITDNDANHI